MPSFWMIPFILGPWAPPAPAPECAFPGAEWEQRGPARLGLDAEALDLLAAELGGRGCVVRNGYVAKAWGDQAAKGDWYSSVKPLFSTLLFFAIDEGLVRDVDQPIREFGWGLAGKDREITFRHLANMTSGYARPEPPGRAWAYNDLAIQLYQRTLFDRVFREDPERAVEARLAPLRFQDGLTFTSKRRLHASVRDFARIGWFWLNRGRWGDHQVLPRRFFEEYQRPGVSADLPNTAKAETVDPLGLGSFGGGSDHFTRSGPGIYGFNWWFNRAEGDHPDRATWPDAPPDTFLSIGFGGNIAVMIPSCQLLLISSKGDWGEIRPGDVDATMNLRLKRLVGAMKDLPR